MGHRMGKMDRVCVKSWKRMKIKGCERNKNDERRRRSIHGLTNSGGAGGQKSLRYLCM